MVAFATIAVFISFLALTIQDLRTRSYVWWLAPICLLSVFGLSASVDAIDWGLIGINVLILIILVAAIYLYSVLRYGLQFKPMDNLIGLGDVLFLFILCFGMNPTNFIVLLLFSSLLGLLLTALMIMNGRKEPMFPLAGVQAGIYVLLVLVVCSQGNKELHT